MEQLKIDLDKCWSYPRNKKGLDDAMMDGCYPIVHKFTINHPELIDQPLQNYSRYNMFLNACCRGHLDIVRWMIDDFPFILMLSTTEDVFIETCASGKIHIARFLYEEVPAIDMRCDGDYAFLSALNNNHYHICKWIYGLRPDIPINDYFEYICQFDDLDSCHFLYNLDHRIVYANDMGAYKNACRFQHDDLTVWFCEIFLENLFTTTSPNTCSICYDQHVVMTTRCGHEFCEKCIFTTMTNLYTHKCPYCRQTMLPFKK